MRVDDDHFRLETARGGSDLFDLAAPDQRRRCRLCQRRDECLDDGEMDRSGETDGFGQTAFGVAIECCALGTRFRFHVNDERVPWLAVFEAVSLLVAYAGSGTWATSCSMSWIGPIGITVEIACL